MRSPVFSTKNVHELFKCFHISPHFPNRFPNKITRPWLGGGGTDLVHAEEIVIIGTLQTVVPGQAATGAAARVLRGERRAGAGPGAGAGGDGGQHHGDDHHPAAVVDHLCSLIAY